MKENIWINTIYVENYFDSKRQIFIEVNIKKYSYFIHVIWDFTYFFYFFYIKSRLSMIDVQFR